jgi:hypothetical protein
LPIRPESRLGCGGGGGVDWLALGLEVVAALVLFAAGSEEEHADSTRAAEINRLPATATGRNGADRGAEVTGYDGT